jgi:hypothetical protein
MHLRVFQSTEQALAVEISSPARKSDLKWFVPLQPENSEMLRAIDPTEIVRVKFRDENHIVPFFLIRTVRITESSQVVVGTLSLEDSINVLNNVYDRLAYD